MEATDIAWTAGFFDGDGTVNFTVKERGYGWVIVGITQKDRMPLDWIAENFGGNVRPERDVYWRWTPPNKEEFLRKIYPYLKLKKERTRRLLEEYYDDTSPAGHNYQGRRVPQRVRDKRQELHDWFRTQTLATKGKPSTAGRG